MHTIRLMKDHDGKGGNVSLKFPGRCHHARIAVLYCTLESEWNLFRVCQRNTFTYVLSLVYLGIFRIYSVLLIALLGIHVAAETHVSFQAAFVCPGCRPHIFAQALRVAEGRSCLYPYGLRGRVYQGDRSASCRVIISIGCGTIPL